MLMNYSAPLTILPARKVFISTETYSHTLVLGGGPAGIGVALAMGPQATVLERASEPGGQSSTITFADAVFDLGGHSFHTPHPDIRALVHESLEMFEQKRDARCYHKGEWVSYPFQQNFRDLTSQETIDACELGLEQRDSSLPCDNFKQFIYSRFGSGISGHFMLPYNQKLWGADLSRMGTYWIHQRVAAPTGKKHEFQRDGGERTPLQATTKVAYPAKGGFHEIFKALADRILNLQTDVEVFRIDPIEKRVWTTTGDSYPYESLVSTLPLETLLKSIDNVPEGLIADVASLEALALDLVLIAVAGPVSTDIQRIYSADPERPAHKIAINHNSSDFLRAQPNHAIMAEVSRPHDLMHNLKKLSATVISDLIDMDILSLEDDILETRVIEIKRAYPVPTHQVPQVLEKVRAWLLERDIHVVGRFAEWAYINSDEALFRGVRLGERLCR